MTSRFAKASVVLLLGFILAGQDVFMASAGNAPTASHAGCNCCKSGSAKCATPVCCAKPAENRDPFAPASIPTTQNQWQALAASGSSELTLPFFSADNFSSRSVPSASLTAVPLFQRNCSYLI